MIISCGYTDILAWHWVIWNQTTNHHPPLNKASSNSNNPNYRRGGGGCGGGSGAAHWPAGCLDEWPGFSTEYPNQCSIQFLAIYLNQDHVGLFRISKVFPCVLVVGLNLTGWLEKLPWVKIFWIRECTFYGRSILLKYPNRLYFNDPKFEPITLSNHI